MVNEKLAEFVKTSKPSVAVVGLGGAGCNITTWIAEKGMAGGKIIAANTDVNHLSTMSKADKLVLLGEKLCKGHGCGGYPEMGQGNQPFRQTASIQLLERLQTH